MRSIESFRDFFGGTPIVFTHHAKDRLKETKVPIGLAESLLRDSLREPIKIDYKKKRYKNDMKHTSFWMSSDLIYTVIDTLDKYSLKRIALVVTVYDRRLNSFYFRTVSKYARQISAS